LRHSGTIQWIAAIASGLGLKRNGMRLPLLLLATAALLGMGPDSRTNLPPTQAGTLKPFGEILQSVSSQVPGRYIGTDFDPETLTYRLKFLNNGNVVNVDVDARTGHILHRRQSF
jgi:hypothetical protein